MQTNATPQMLDSSIRGSRASLPAVLRSAAFSDRWRPTFTAFPEIRQRSGNRISSAAALARESHHAASIGRGHGNWRQHFYRKKKGESVAIGYRMALSGDRRRSVKQGIQGNSRSIADDAGERRDGPIRRQRDIAATAFIFDCCGMQMGEPPYDREMQWKNWRCW